MTMATKTADEMFRELGYGKKGETTGGGVRYDSMDRKSIVVNPKVVSKAVFPNGFGQDFTQQEILACAQLIKEMEDEK